MSNPLQRDIKAFQMQLRETCKPKPAPYSITFRHPICEHGLKKPKCRLCRTK